MGLHSKLLERTYKNYYKALGEEHPILFRRWQI